MEKIKETMERNSIAQKGIKHKTKTESRLDNSPESRLDNNLESRQVNNLK